MVRDLEEGEGDRGARRREEQVAEDEAVAEHQPARRVVEQLGHHRVGDQRQHDDLDAAPAQEVDELVHLADPRGMRP